MPQATQSLPLRPAGDATVHHIDLTFHCATADGDGFTIQGSFDPAVGWCQWGQGRERLSDNVALIEALYDAWLQASNPDDL